MKLLFIILLSTCLYCQLSAWLLSSGGRPNDRQFAHDMTDGSDLRNLYNKQVVTAELVERPLSGFSWAWGPISHSGVRVTTEDGSQYLVHKGSDFGISSETVVVDASHMSDKWKVKDVVPVYGKSVSDFVEAGGDNYNLIFDNCHDAAERMINQ